jgi:hypothetical protein
VADYQAWLDGIETIVALGNTLYLQISQVGDNSVIGIWPVTSTTNNAGFAGDYYDISLGTPLVANGSFGSNLAYTISWVFNGLDGVGGSGGGEILNPGDYRILTATGSSSTASVAWDGLTYDGLTFSVSGNQVITSGVSGSTVFSVEGTNGDLFQVTDDLSNSLMSVNNISGLPVFEVFANDTILYGDFSARGYTTTIKKTVSASGSLFTVDSTLYNGVFMEYVLVTGTNSRVGTFTVVSNGTTINSANNTIATNGTVGFTFSAATQSGLIDVRCSAITGTHTLKAIVRAI